jgi:hypothetical protein
VDHLALPTGSSKPTTFCSKSSKKIYNWPCWRCPLLALSGHDALTLPFVAPSRRPKLSRNTGSPRAKRDPINGQFYTDCLCYVNYHFPQTLKPLGLGTAFRRNK